MFGIVTPRYSPRYSPPAERGARARKVAPTVEGATSPASPATEEQSSKRKGGRKNGNNLGSIYKEPDRGTWRVAIPTGEIDPASGRAKVARKRFSTEKDARAFYSRAIAERERGTLRSSSGRTLAAFLEEWLSVKVEPNLAPKTAVSYRQTLEAYVIPRLGRKKLEAVAHDDVQRMINDLAKTRKQPRRFVAEGEKSPVLPFLSHRQVSAVRDVLRAAYGHAAGPARLVGHNPVDGVTIPKSARRPLEKESLTRDQVEKLLAVVRGTRDEALITFLLGTGARIGEALGLRWQDVMLGAVGEGGAVCYRGQLQRFVGEGLVWTEGTKTGKRTPLLIPEAVAAALRSLQGARLVDGFQDGGIVFLNEDGRRTDPSLVNRRLRRYCLAAGIHEISVHVLRHTALTFAVEATGDLHSVSKSMAGHTTTRLMDRYAHLLEGRDRVRADALGRAMFGS